MRSYRFIAAALALVCPVVSADDRPNIVFILADDLGVNDLSCYGRSDQSTPHLDALAQRGMRFTSAYCAQPICSPTRAALMTGKTPARLHLTTFLPGRADAPSQLLLHPEIRQQLPLEEVTIAERLKEAGYATACIGKWHLGGQGFLPTDQGFDEYSPGRANTPPSNTEGGKGEFGLTSRAEAFIDANKSRPFYLYLAHNNPHVPLAAKPDLVARHVKAFNPVYAAMIETLDDCVGRIVAKIDSLNLTERTLIVFQSDNGGLHVPEGPRTPATHNTPYRAGKGYLYEGGLRVPLIARWPSRIATGSVIDQPVIATDWVPTLLELAGRPAAELTDGVSLAGLLSRETPLADRSLYWHFPHYTNQGGRPAGAIRDGDWKLIEHYEDGRCELFQLATDRSETTDRSAAEPARVAQLRGRLETWRRACSAQTNAANPEFNGAAWRSLYHDTDTSRLALAPTAAELETKLADWRQVMNDVLPRRGQDELPKVTAGAGAIVLHARDARVHGSRLRYEPEPHKDTIGFWTDAADWVSWEFDVPKPGTFDVEILQGCGKGSGGAVIKVQIGETDLTLTVEETGHFQRFIPRRVGTVTISKAGRATLALRPETKPGPAVMDVRRVTLRSR